MKYLATIALLFALALPAHAQNPGVSTTDPTTSGVTLILTGGTPPFNLWQWDGISTWNSRAVSVAGENIIVNWHYPGQSITYRVTGAGIDPNNGVNVTVTALGIPDPNFNDVPQSHWAYPFIAWAAHEGITAGCGNGNFCPDAQVTRAEMAVFLKRLHDLVNE